MKNAVTFFSNSIFEFIQTNFTIFSSLLNLNVMNQRPIVK